MFNRVRQCESPGPTSQWCTLKVHAPVLFPKSKPQQHLWDGPECLLFISTFSGLFLITAQVTSCFRGINHDCRTHPLLPFIEGVISELGDLKENETPQSSRNTNTHLHLWSTAWTFASFFLLNKECFQSCTRNSLRLCEIVCYHSLRGHQSCLLRTWLLSQFHGYWRFLICIRKIYEKEWLINRSMGITRTICLLPPFCFSSYK